MRKVFKNGFITPFPKTSDIVRTGGIEPPRPKPQEPKSCASTNSAMRAATDLNLTHP